MGSTTLQVVLYLQQWSVLRHLLLHLLQQPLDFFSQFCLQLWLDDVGQRSWKRRAQRVNMALPQRKKELKTDFKRTQLHFRTGSSPSFKKERGETTLAATYCTYFEYCGQRSSRFVFASLCKCQMLTISYNNWSKQSIFMWHIPPWITRIETSVASLALTVIQALCIFFPQLRNLRIKQKEFVQQGKTVL